MNFKNVIIIIFHAFVIWMLCGLTIAIGRMLISMDYVLIIHAVLAPVFTILVSIIYYKKFHFTTPIQTAIIFILIIVLLDAGLVAPVFEKSYIMFKSFLGTWLPFTLIFLATYITGLIFTKQHKSII